MGLTTLCLTEQIVKWFDGILHTGYLYIDPQKAFDAINQNIFLEKLRATYFFQNIVNWFISYLQDQQFWKSVSRRDATRNTVREIINIYTWSTVISISYEIMTCLKPSHLAYVTQFFLLLWPKNVISQIN